MKKLFTIAFLATAVSGCTVFSPSRTEKLNPTIGMNENDFKQLNRRATLVYLSNDTTIYKLYKGSTDQLTYSDFYYFSKNKLYKFELKTHYFNKTTVKIEESKSQEN